MLYQKYRPQSFDQVVGNEVEMQSLEKAITGDNPTHVFLLSGPQGTGKTTAARICAGLLKAGELDVREVNSSNNRGIDTAREIIDKMRYQPADGDAIVYIIDEVHKTTNDWQNAMLKPLEDTPDHVFFFLCTTDPQKLIAPLRNRCTEIKLKGLSIAELVLVMRRVRRAEQLDVAPALLEEIAEAADGSPRKALVILEKVSKIADPEKRLEAIRSGMLGEESAEAIELCRALISEKASWKDVCQILKTIPKEDDPEKVRWAVMGYMSAVLLGGRKNDRAAMALDAFSTPFYDTARNGLTLAAYRAVFAR